MIRAKLFAAVVLMAACTGCLTSRSIRVVSESGDRNLTLIQTNDTYTYLPSWTISKHQFWSCREESDALTCKKVCDSKNSQLACMITAGGPGGSTQTANSTSK